MRASWALVLKRVSWEALGRRLYETIFDEAPSLEAMFGRSAVTMGIKMVDMIDGMVAALDDPPAVHRRMEGLGAVHHRHGVRAREHMPVFQGVVERLLRGALLEDYTGEVAEAWGWLWGWLTESMLVVEAASHARASLIRRSWDAVNGALTVAQIGGAIYDTLFQVPGRAGRAPPRRSLLARAGGWRPGAAVARRSAAPRAPVICAPVLVTRTDFVASAAAAATCSLPIDVAAAKLPRASASS